MSAASGDTRASAVPCWISTGSSTDGSFAALSKWCRTSQRAGTHGSFCAASSGRYFTTGSLSNNRPCSISIIAATETMGLVIE